MTEKLKEIIKNAKHIEEGTFKEFLIIPTGEKYDGFWGENGFDEMIILAGNYNNGEWYLLTNFSDTFNILPFNPFHRMFGINFDSPSDYGCLRVFFDNPIEIESVASSVIARPKED